jgi:hypothetical protein
VLGGVDEQGAPLVVDLERRLESAELDASKAESA